MVRKHLVVSGLLMIWLFAVTAAAMMPPGLESSDAYRFPVPVESATWKAMESRAERLATCVIPDSVLERISTRGLLATCLEFPFAIDILFHETPLDGTERVIADFNGLQALISRPDAAREILIAYQSIPAAAVDRSLPLAEQGAYGFTIRYLELLLAQEEVLANADEGDRRALLDAALTSLVSKSESSDVYGGSAIHASAFLAARALESVEFGPFLRAMEEDSTLREFVSTGATKSRTVVAQIVGLSQDCLGR